MTATSNDHEPNGSSNEVDVETKTKPIELSPMQQLEMRAKWASSRYRMMIAKADAQDLEIGHELQVNYRKYRVSQDQLQAAFRFIESSSQGWRAAQLRNVQIGGQTLNNLPMLMSVVGKCDMFAAYVKGAAQHDGFVYGVKSLCRSSFFLAFDALTRMTECKASLLYYFTDGLHALDLLGEMLSRADALYQLHTMLQSSTSLKRLNRLAFHQRS